MSTAISEHKSNENKKRKSYYKHIDPNKFDIGTKRVEIRTKEIDPNRLTSMQVSRETITKVISVGKYGETYDQIINKLIDFDIKMEEKRLQGKLDQ